MTAPWVPAPLNKRSFAGYGDIGAEPFYYDDFMGDGASAEWDLVTLGNGTAGMVSTSGGAVELAMTSASGSADAVLDHFNVLSFDAHQALVWECRLRMTVAPAVTTVFGMASDHVAGVVQDNIARSAWFRLQASNSIRIETDDTDTNNDDKFVNQQIVVGTHNVFTIDFRDLTDVKFFVDGQRKPAGTTFDMSGLSAAEGLLQPYFSMDRSSGTSLGTMEIDYVKIWQDRGA